MLDVLLNQPEEKPGPDGILKVSDRADKPIKSIMKSISWRVVGTIDTMVISYLITGKLTLALSIGSVEVLTKDSPLLFPRKAMGSYTQDQT